MSESLQTLGWIILVFIGVPVMFLILVSVIHAIQYKITGIRMTRSLNKLLKKIEHISFENNDEKPLRKSTHYLSIIVAYDKPTNSQRKKEKIGIFFDLEEAYRFVESQGYEYHQIYEMLDYATVCVECGAFQHITLYFPTWHEVQELNYCHKCGNKFDDSYVEKCIKQIHKNQKFYERGRFVGTEKP